jgi:hypothetical protein
MQFGKAFTFVFEDPKWLQKVGIAALIILIPIVGPFAVFGWSLEVTRRVINNDPELLPTFSDFVGHLMRGLKAFVIGLVYVLPIILVSACSNGLMVGIGSAASNQNSDVIGGSIAVLTTCIVCFASIYGILAGLLLPAAFGNFIATDKLGAAFRIGEVWGLFRANPGAYLLVFVGTILSGLIASLGTIICLVGALFTLAYSQVINGHLYGQAYLAAKAK